MSGRLTPAEGMLGDERAGDLSPTYRDADERLRLLNGYAVKKVRDTMSATPGWQAAAKAAAAHAVLVSNQRDIEAMLTTLLQAHIEAGERNPETVTEQVRERFLSKLTAPGLEFFEGSSSEAATLSRVALKHAAEFESWRDALAGDLVNRFRRVLSEHVEARASTGASRAELRTPVTLVLLGFLIVTTMMSLCGVSLLDALRRILALF